MRNPSTCNCECNKACKIDKYLDVEICSTKKRLIGKLVLEYEDEMFNTTETLLHDEKMQKKQLPYSQDFISNYMIVAISGCFC